MKVTTNRGVVLDTDHIGAKNITNYAVSLDFKNLVCCLAKFPEGTEEYVLLENNEPIYSSTRMEDVGSHIDKLFIERQFVSHKQRNMKHK